MTVEKNRIQFVDAVKGISIIWLIEEEEEQEERFEAQLEAMAGNSPKGQNDDDFVLSPFFGGFIQGGSDFFEKEGKKK